MSPTLKAVSLVFDSPVFAPITRKFLRGELGRALFCPQSFHTSNTNYMIVDAEAPLTVCLHYSHYFTLFSWERYSKYSVLLWDNIQSSERAWLIYNWSEAYFYFHSCNVISVVFILRCSCIYGMILMGTTWQCVCWMQEVYHCNLGQSRS